MVCFHHTVRLPIAVAVTLLCTLGSCRSDEPAGADAPALQTTLSIRADLSGTPIATVVVRVTAPDIATPLAFNISTVRGVAAGTITIPAGSNRTLALQAYDAGGIEIDSGSVTLNLQPGLNPTVSILLTPLPGQPPITVVVGSFSVTTQSAADTLAPGDTVTVTATTLDASGNPITGQVGWATLDPKVATVVSTGQQRGRVTATGPGRTTVVAIYGGMAGPTAIAVTNPLWPNEPAGFTVITDLAENSVTGGGWQDAYPGSGLVNIISDATAPLSPQNVLQFLYPIGFMAGAAPATIFYEQPEIITKELYVGFWWKPSDPFQSDVSGVSKIAFCFSQAGNGQMYIMMEGAAAPHHLIVSAAFLGYGDARNLLPNVNDPDVTLGAWHRIEWYAKYGSGANGIVKFWLDGLLVGNYTDVVFPNDVGFDQFQFSPTFGGITSVKTENDYFWYDHVHISKP
jgi:Big-like domain-containing protein